MQLACTSSVTLLWEGSLGKVAWTQEALGFTLFRLFSFLLIDGAKVWTQGFTFSTYLLLIQRKIKSCQFQDKGILISLLIKSLIYRHPKCFGYLRRNYAAKCTEGPWKGPAHSCQDQIAWLGTGSQSTCSRSYPVPMEDQEFQVSTLRHNSTPRLST